MRLFTYQCVSRGATGLLYFLWRQARIGSEKFYGGVLTHDGRGENRVYKEISHIGDEMKLLAPALEGTKVVAETCILLSHDNEWAMQQGPQPNPYFNQREHLQLFYNALHDRNISVDFARPTEDLSKYKLVIAPSLKLLAGGEADLLKLYVQNGGIRTAAPDVMQKLRAAASLGTEFIEAIVVADERRTGSGKDERCRRERAGGIEPELPRERQAVQQVLVLFGKKPCAQRHEEQPDVG